jgi:DNA-binding FadR family transcriptional regulator
MLSHDSTAPAPNQLWVNDLTFVPIWAGIAYVCFLTDAFSRMIVGWRVASHMRTSGTPVEIQLAALYARDDDFAFLRRTIDAIAVAADNQDPFQTLDMRFHIGIACAIGNITVLRLAKLLTGTLWAARKLLPTYGLETPDFTLDIHTTTLAALMSRNPANVAAVMDEDLAQLKHAWQRENQRTVGCAAC